MPRWKPVEMEAQVEATLVGMGTNANAGKSFRGGWEGYVTRELGKEVDVCRLGISDRINGRAECARSSIHCLRHATRGI